MKLSIITINYNNASGLRKTMESVFAQTCKDFEYIIVDGASADGSVDIIRELVAPDFNDKLKTVVDGVDVVVSSEPDTGIYNAMNKGVRAAKSEYVLMLNSGDYFVDEHVVERILPELDGTDIVQGNILEYGKGCIVRNSGYKKSDLTMNDVYLGYFLHQASFCKRILFDQYGYFDESYKIVADTKFFQTCLGIGNASFRYINLDIAYYDMRGVSSNSQVGNLREKERQRIYKELFSDRMLGYLTTESENLKIVHSLQKYKWTWNLVRLLRKILLMASPKSTLIHRIKLS